MGWRQEEKLVKKYWLLKEKFSWKGKVYVSIDKKLKIKNEMDAIIDKLCMMREKRYRNGNRK